MSSLKQCVHRPHHLVRQNPYQTLHRFLYSLQSTIFNENDEYLYRYMQCHKCYYRYNNDSSSLSRYKVYTLIRFNIWYTFPGEVIIILWQNVTKFSVTLSPIFYLQISVNSFQILANCGNQLYENFSNISCLKFGEQPHRSMFNLFTD